MYKSVCGSLIMTSFPRRYCFSLLNNRLTSLLRRRFATTVETVSMRFQSFSRNPVPRETSTAAVSETQCSGFISHFNEIVFNRASERIMIRTPGLLSLIYDDRYGTKLLLFENYLLRIRVQINTETCVRIRFAWYTAVGRCDGTQRARALRRRMALF